MCGAAALNWQKPPRVATHASHLAVRLSAGTAHATCRERVDGIGTMFDDNRSLSSTGAPAGTALRVLLIEDAENDAMLILNELRRGDYEPAWERVDTPAALRSALERRTWDPTMSCRSWTLSPP